MDFSPTAIPAPPQLLQLTLRFLSFELDLVFDERNKLKVLGQLPESWIATMAAVVAISSKTSAKSIDSS